MNRTMIVILGFGFGFGLIGCGGNDDTGGEGLDSGVDADKKGDELTEEEVEQFCVAIGDYVQDSGAQRAACVAVGFASGVTALVAAEDAEEACTAAYDECLKGDDLTPECDEEAPVDCDNTVAEIEDCFQDFVDAQVAELERFSLPPCDDIEEWVKDHADELEELEDREEIGLEDIATCESLDDACLD